MRGLRRAIYEIEPYRPGLSVAEVKAKIMGLERVIKLGSNESALPPLPEALEAISRAAKDSNRYPDPGAVELREALAEKCGVSPPQVVPGAGADELIRLIATATLEPGRNCVFPWPGFPTYAQGASAAGARPIAVPCPADRLDLKAILANVDDTTSLVCLANPNNPTGAYATGPDLVAFLDTLPPKVICLLDEAYVEYVDPAVRFDSTALVREGRENVCIVRTFSKAYGLAALRVGYAVTSLLVADALDRVRTMFNVNQIGQAAALAVIQCERAIETRAAAVRDRRALLATILASAGLCPLPSQGNFVFAELPGESLEAHTQSAAWLADRLLKEGIIVRRMDGFGAPDALRVTVGTAAEHDALAGALARSQATGL